ncbi:MAG TPA: hypothetical protein PKU96_01055 [bacterium]|nr:hypothetical protein [Myxococcales bacterium]OQA61054.1 MAG: hypothetical protein BWY40_00724 [bacterium ADurb.Bin270]HPW44942.1 hypothetical protein [bacterium]HQC50968.1 hypothetical protein [bacterium]HQG13228.1 hypothetical protein [bacterium]
MKKPKRTSTRKASYDQGDTKNHVMAAGREILLAARGALRFCKDYVENSPDSASKQHLASFFSKAMAVADDLGKSILEISPVKQAAEHIAKSFLSSVGEEMKNSSDKTPRSHKNPVHNRKKGGRRK